MGSISQSQLGIFGDTILGSDTYHKLYASSIPCADTLMTQGNSFLYGAIREDSLKRVYYYPFGSTTFCQPDISYKIYDFSKTTPGDTIQFDTSSASSCYPLPTRYITIDYVDSILINNSYRKYFHFLECEPWIEGIGSLRNLLAMISPAPACSCFSALLCNKQNDSLFYMNPVYNYCYCDLGTNIPTSEEKELFTIYPNPFTTSTTFISNNQLTNSTLTIFNSAGQRVKFLENISGETITISRDNLSDGIYYLTVMEGGTIVSAHKLLIHDK
ncbi:MAG: hypothetical protein K0S44_1093 [Bacteroidetes bacterium]|nr:hypothetical protein [Bacteroidota bacterium]